MKVYSAAQIKDLDRAAIASGISAAKLMANAADAVTSEVLRRYPRQTRALVLAGPGNNGGDGYGVAGRLLAAGSDVTVLEVTERPGSPEARSERDSFVANGGAPRALTCDAFTAALTGAHPPDLVIDALFGVGLTRRLDGELAAVVETLARSRAPVVSIDVPSGVDADRADLPGPHVRADLTVQLAGPKLASLYHPARAAYGTSVVVAIGVPDELAAAISVTELLEPGDTAGRLPSRAPDAHKYSAGTVCVVAGSTRYQGAAELACRGAWRGGAGLVTLVARERFSGAWPETVFEPWQGTAWPPPALAPKSAGAVVFGPGLDDAAAERLPDVVRWAPGPVVVDASALAPGLLARALGARTATTITAAGSPLVITPHFGEAARLLDVPAAQVAAAPWEAALELSRRYESLCVLKGSTSIVVAPDGRAAISPHGHPGMAAGGTGDVLAGLLGALLAAWAADRQRGADAAQSGPEAFEVVCAAVLAHGLAGEAAASHLGRSLVASDVVGELPRSLKRLADSQW